LLRKKYKKRSCYLHLWQVEEEEEGGVEEEQDNIEEQEKQDNIENEEDNTEDSKEDLEDEEVKEVSGSKTMEEGFFTRICWQSLQLCL